MFCSPQEMLPPEWCHIDVQLAPGCLCHILWHHLKVKAVNPPPPPPPIAHMEVFQRRRGRHHMVNYSFICCDCNQTRLCPCNHCLWYGSSSVEIYHQLFLCCIPSCLMLVYSVKWFSYENTLFSPKFLPLTLLWLYTEVRSSKWAWLKFRCCIRSCPQFQLKSGPM